METMGTKRSRSLLRASLWVVVLVSATGCSAVRSSWISDEFETVDKKATYRLEVVTAPLPDGQEPVAEMWSLMARRYVNQKRDFIAWENVSAPAFDLARHCIEDNEGVLHLAPDVTRKGDGVEAAVKATLYRCDGNVEIWRAEGGGSWPTEDENLLATADVYAGEFGDDVRPFVPATFHLLRAVLDTLPFPALEDEEDVLEKIELGE